MDSQLAGASQNAADPEQVRLVSTDVVQQVVTEDYNESEIKVLKGLEAVRERPAMYIADTGVRGLHHIVFEVVDNSIDEALAGHCTEISVVMHRDGSVSITDDGRGIPVGIHPTEGIPTLQVVMTQLHAGGKFEGKGYKYSGGLHGVGVSVSNALSLYLEAVVYRDGKKYIQRFNRGIVDGDMEEQPGEPGRTGTSVTLKPDPSIFRDTVEFSYDIFNARLRELAFLNGNAGLTIKIADEATGRSDKHCYAGGLKEFITYLNKGKNTLSDIFYINRAVDDILVEVALQYTDSYSETFYSFANNIHTVEGGSHVTGFRSALTRVSNNYLQKAQAAKSKSRSKANEKKKNDEGLTGDDCRDGLTAIVSVKLTNPQFESQTKISLLNNEVRAAVDNIFNEYYDQYLDEHPNEAQEIMAKCLKAQQARIAAKRARETVQRKGLMDAACMPGKLADCTYNDNERTELFIVEGNSAGGSAKEGRDRFTQAILPLRGKILNVERVRLDRMLANAEIGTMIKALGTGIGPEFNIDKRRYKYVIIMTDADVDGSHIRTLLLTFFYRHMPELIKQGHVLIANPPLYKLSKGKYSEYLYEIEDDARKEERDQQLLDFVSSGDSANETAELQAAINGPDYKPGEWSKIHIEDRLKIRADLLNSLARIRGEVRIQRYKGLGEMNADQLGETTMSREKRYTTVVKVEDAEKADRLFSILMGDLVEPRRQFIVAHAPEVKNLDV